MRGDTTWAKEKAGLKNSQKITQEKALLKLYRRRLTENVCINQTITWSTTKSSIWNSQVERQRPSVCAVSQENKPVSCKSWGLKERYVVTWKIIGFPFMTSLLNRKQSLSLITRLAGMAVVTLV